MKQDIESRHLIISQTEKELEGRELRDKNGTSKFLCVVCKKPTLLCCSDCQDVFYCSLLHQQLDWKAHLSICKKTEKMITRTNFIPNTNDEILLKEQKFPINNVENSKISEISLNSKPKYETLLTEDKSHTNSFEREKNEIQMADLFEDRTNKIREILYHFVNHQNNQAIIKAKKLFQISKKIFEISKAEDPFLLLTDGMLFVKTYLKVDKLHNAREILLELWEIAKSSHIDEKIVSEKQILDQSNSKSSLLKTQNLFFINDDSLSLKVKSEINRKIIKIIDLYSSFGSLFYSVGDFNNCEQAYVKYTKTIENNFGGESYEASNCFYLLGVFYLQHKYFVKAMACLKKSLNIRIKKLGDENHESIADCYYNIGIIYKQNEKYSKSITSLNSALKIRASLIGEISIPVSQVLEILGKVYLLAEDYSSAFHKFHDCLNIRRKLLKNPQHIDIIRITKLLQDLFEKIQINYNDKTLNSKSKDLLNQLRKQMIQSKSLDGLFMEINSKLLKENEIIGNMMTHEKNVSSPVKETPIEKIGNGKNILENESISKRIPEIVENSTLPLGTLKTNDYYLNKPQEIVSASYFGELNFASKTKPDNENYDLQKTYEIERLTFHPDHPIIEFASSDTNKDTENRVSQENTQREEENKFQIDSITNKVQNNIAEVIKENLASTSSLHSQISNTRERKSSNKSKGLNLDNKFLQNLDTDRILELNELKSVIKKKKYQDVGDDILNSDFFKNLQVEERKTFLEDNKHLFQDPKFQSIFIHSN